MTIRLLKAAKWAALTLVFFLLSVMVGAWGLLATERGRVWLAESTVSAINHRTDFHIVMGEITTPSLDNWQATSLRIQQNKRLIVDAQQLKLRWKPARLWQQELDLDLLQIDILNIAIKTAKTQKKGDYQRFPLQEIISLRLPAVRLKQLAINRITLQELSLRAQPMPDISLEGEVQLLSGQPPLIRLEARSLGKTSTHAHVVLRPSLNQLVIEGSLDENPGGPVGELLMLPTHQAVDADVQLTADIHETGYTLNINTLHLPIAKDHVNIQGQVAIIRQLTEGNLEGLTIIIDETTHQLSGHWNQQELDFSVELNQLPLDIFSPWQQYLKTGHISAQVHISGPIKSPRVVGSLDMDTRYQELPLSLKLSSAGDENHATIEQLEANWGHTLFTAKGNLDWIGNNSNVAMTLDHFDVGQLQHLGIVVPKKLNARVVAAKAHLNGNAHALQGHATATIEGRYVQQPFTLRAKLAKSSDNLVIEDATLSMAEGIATAQGTLDTQSLLGKLTINAESIPLSLLELADIRLPEGLAGNAKGELTMEGSLEAPTIRVRTQLEGRYQDIPFVLRAKGQGQQPRLTIESLTLSTFDEPVLSLHGTINPQQLDIKLVINRLPTQVLAAAGCHIQAGRFNLNFRVRGSFDQPNINGTLLYESQLAGFDKEGELKGIAFGWQMAITTHDGIYTLASEFMRGDSPSGQLLVNIPHEPYREFFKQNPTMEWQQLPLKASLSGHLGLQTVSFLLDPELHRLDGNLDGHLQLTGTLTTPKIEGAVSIANGRYQNPITGTIVNKIDCTLSATENFFSLTDCEATDDNSGKYQLFGDIRLPYDSDLGAVDLALKSTQANILRRPDIESEATGELELFGDIKRIHVKGDLNVAPLTANLDAGKSNDIPKIKVIKVETSADLNGITKETPSLFPTMTLDIRISADQQAFLRGRGLEAELKGHVYVRGTLLKPRYDGEFQTIRGVFEVFGKKFTLERGTVTFSNNAIGLDIEGVYTKSGQQIRAQLSGTTDDIKLHLTSIPSMADDEILAFIIFGKSVQTITPFQAVQLASAVQTLRGGGGFDPINSARKLLGVDSLSIETENNGDGQTDVNVGIGKYLNENVYLELERTANPTQPWKGNLQIEIAPSLHLESSTSGTSGTEGAELKWKKDY